MKPVLFQFKSFRTKLPPIRKPLLLIDIADRLWAGEFYGVQRIYDFDAGRNTNRRGYSMEMRLLGEVGSRSEVVEKSELSYWVEVPARV